jgi:hypothetical protein
MLEKAKKTLLRIRIARKKGADEKQFADGLKKLITLKSRLPLQLLG